MKSKEELLGDYREMSKHNALHKDEVFLAVLIDIGDFCTTLRNGARSRCKRDVSQCQWMAQAWFYWVSSAPQSQEDTYQKVDLPQWSSFGVWLDVALSDALGVLQLL